jgi:hypothetical protein
MTEPKNPSFRVWVKNEAVDFTSAFPTLASAWHALSGLPNLSDFARDLLQRGRERKLSDMQIAWIHKLATDGTARARGEARQPVLAANLNLRPVVAMMEKAAAAAKGFPRIELTCDGHKLVLALAGSKSKSPGTVNITDGRPYGVGKWFGRIDVAGAVQKGRDWHPGVEAKLRQLAADPAKVANQHGVATGRCCFCSRDLSTAESRSVGYGPICADHFGLPWGDTTVADAADAAAKQDLPPATPAAADDNDPFRGLGFDSGDRGTQAQERQDRQEQRRINYLGCSDPYTGSGRYKGD